MHPSVRKAVVSLLTVTMTMGLFGCGTMPTAPPAPSAVSQAASSPSHVRQAETSGLLGGLVDALVGLIVRTLNIVGSLGGTLSNGRFTIDIPSGAIQGTANVALGVANPRSYACELRILPEDRNGFSKPVMLTVNCSDVPLSALRDYVVFWFNPETRQWVPVPGSAVNLSTKKCSAPLQHFSTYSVGPKSGKAGW
jgi:hypothetical protein